jgi:hypothetical protein
MLFGISKTKAMLTGGLIFTRIVTIVTMSCWCVTLLMVITTLKTNQSVYKHPTRNMPVAAIPNLVTLKLKIRFITPNF